VAASPPVAQPAVTPRLSIVVLPFANLSSDPEQQYFADGITEDLTTDLSRIAHMLVISRNTAFTYRGKPIDTKQIGRELGVRYVLEGSVRRLGNQIRINAQLIDAEADAHLWAERFTGDTSDLFALQDEITSRIAVALNLELINVEAARPTDNPNTLDYIFRGRAAFSKPQSQDSFSDFSEAVGFFERAVALDPKSVEARSWLATALAVRKLNGITASATTDIARAKALVGQALAASPRSPLAHFANGQVLRAQGRHEEAIPEFEEVIAFNRNWVGAYGNLGQCKFFVARVEEAIQLVVQAIRLSPRDPSLDSWYTWIGRMHLVQSRVDEAIICFEKARSANPASMIAHASLASAHALRGETERAAADLAEARRLSPDDRHSSIARLKAAPIYIGAPKILALFETTYFAGLRLAGMPED
jgi:TolB-like protein/Flp pilus assembly protein TadD